MLDRHFAGRIPAKHHIAFRDDNGNLLHEECATRQGFDGPYTLMYHQNEPHRHTEWRAYDDGFQVPIREPAESSRVLRRRHFKSFEMAPSGGSPLQARIPMMFNQDVVVSILKPTRSDNVYWTNVDGDDLYYIHRGKGVLRSVLGDVAFSEQDYVFVPRGIKHRFILEDDTPQWWIAFECRKDFYLPKQWRTQNGQFRMDAPFCHRDFRKPEFMGPMDEGIRGFVTKANDQFTYFGMADSPLDVVGWDGSVYPWAFAITNFQPRAGLVHLPPDWHGNFAFPGGLICSFVPRVVDFHPEAIPCPYPHEAVQCDEFLFYAEGNFISRRGISSGSISFHPRGVMHGPHPGAYEKSIGHKRTDELAVMMDTALPLFITAQALDIEDNDYHGTWKP